MVGLDTTEKPDEKKEDVAASPEALFRQVDRLLKDDTIAGIEKGAPAKFFDAAGKPIENLVGRKEPVISISVDENGDARVAIYTNGQSARDRKEPELLVVVSRTKDADVSTETRKFVEPGKGGEDKPTATVITEINKKENTATIRAITGADEQTVKFKNGLPLLIDQKNPLGGLHCEIGPDGKITKLEINGKEPDAAKVKAIVEALQQTADLVATENGFPKPPRLSFKDVAAPTLTERPAGGERAAEKIEVVKLPPEKQLEVERTQELQGQILLLVDKMKFESDDERKQFKERLKAELGVGAGPGTFSELPKFGAATQEGFRKLVELHQKATLPGMIVELDRMQLPFPPGCPLEIHGRKVEIAKSGEQFRQEVARGLGKVDIDPAKLEDIGKLRRINDWLETSNNKLEAARMDRLEKYLNNKVEDGIRSGQYPEGWRRPKDMDVKTWCVAVDKAMVQYDRATKMIEMIDHLQKSGKGFKSEALKEKELPPGLTIERDKDGKVTKVKFDERLMISNLSLQSDDNKKKLDVLNAYCAKFETETRGAMMELLKDQKDIPGYGEAEVKGGWISPDGKEFVVGNEKPPHEDWKKFNLISYNMKVETDKTTGKIKVSTECAFEEVPWFGYLNSFAESKFVQRSKSPVEYDPDSWVAVQTRPIEDGKQLVPGVQFVKARDLEEFKAKQALEHYGNKAIMFTMDAAMVVGGGLHVASALKVAQLGAKEAVAIGAHTLKTEAVTDIPKFLVARALGKGAFEIGLGVTGIFHNAGAHEIPWMKGVSDGRSMWFLGHATFSVAQLARHIPAVAKATEAAASAVPRVHSVIESITGTESTMKALAQAQAGAMSKLPHGFEGLEKATQAAFYVSDKAFLTMFSWDMIRMGQRLRERPDQVNQAFRAFRELNANDKSALEKFAAGSAVTSDHVAAYLGRYRDTLVSASAKFDPEKLVGDFVSATRAPISDQDRKALVEHYRNAFFAKPSPEAVQQMDQIIARMTELSKPGVSPEARKAYADELTRYFRYSGDQIHRRQNGRSEELLPPDLVKLAAADHKELDPNVRRVAALALLSLTRKTDGSWNETVAQRTIDVPPFDLVTYDSEGNQHTRTVPGRPSHQKVSAKELIDLLQGDLTAETNDSVRLEKAMSMHDIGLVSNEQVADMLLKRIDGSTETDKGKRLEAVVDLAALMSKVKVGESVSDLIDTAEDKQSRKGLTIGLTHADLLRRVEQLAAKTDDKDLRATLTLAMTMMKKDTFDQVDKERMEAAFLKKPPGISEEELTKILRADMDATPTDRAGWERKLAAADTLSRIAVLSGKVDLDAARALRDCVMDTKGKFPAVSLRATRAFLEPVEGVRLLDRLEAAQKGVWKTRIVAGATNLLEDISVSKATTPAEKLEAAKAKEALIPLLVTTVRDLNDNALTSNLNALLQRSSNRQNEGVQEIRAAALRGLAVLNIRDEDTMKAVSAHLTPELEPSPVVRLAAVQAYEQLNGFSMNRKEVLGSLAAAEPDPAVRQALIKFYEPGGDPKDVGSQKTQKDVADAVTVQNRIQFPREDVQAWLQGRFPALLTQANLFDYFDRKKEMVQRVAGKPVPFEIAWRDSVANSKTGNWAVGAEGQRSAGEEQLIGWELLAQNRAVAAYRREIDALHALASGGSKADTKVGSKTISDSDASIRALGWIASSPSQFGKAITHHQIPNDGRDPNQKGPYLWVPFTPEQERMRTEAIDRSLQTVVVDGKTIKEKLVKFSHDPGDEMQIYAASKLAELATTSRANINLEVVVEQLVAGLESTAKTSDKSRMIMIEALDKVLANPNTNIETKRRILSDLTRIVGNTAEASDSKKESLGGMMVLLDRYKGNFEPFSADVNSMRTALLSRSSLDSVNTPPAARMAAQELFDRQWQSVVGEHSRTRAGTQTPRERAEMLPKNLDALTAANTFRKNDELVHHAVQQIIQATKGEPLRLIEPPRNPDPRLDQIMKLTSEKYNDRVRVAAMMALAQSPDLKLREKAAEMLYTFALTSLESANAPDKKGYEEFFKREDYNRALRNDAFKLLETLPSPAQLKIDQDLDQMKTSLATALSGATGQPADALKGKSNDDLIRMTADYIAQKKNSDNPVEKLNAQELTRRLHLFAEANTLVATQMTKKGDLDGARKLYDSALLAFGLDKAGQEEMRESAKRNNHIWTQSQYDVQQRAAKLIETVQATGSFPALQNALAGQARVSALRLSRSETPSTELIAELDRSIGMISLAGAVAGKYHPEQSIGLAEFYTTMGDVYKQIGAPTGRLAWKDRWNGFASTAYEQANKELGAFRVRESNQKGSTSSVDDLIAKNQHSAVIAQLERLRFVGRTNPTAERLKELGEQLDKSMAQHPDKTSPSYHLQRFLRGTVESEVLPAGQRDGATARASEALGDLLAATKKAHGAASPEYSIALSRMWMFNEQLKQPEKTEEFFKKALSETNKPAERLVLLGQYHNFLTKTLAKPRPELTEAESKRKDDQLRRAQSVLAEIQLLRERK